MPGQEVSGMRRENDKRRMKTLKNSIKKGANQLWKSTPILLGVILLVSLANTIIPKETYTSLFRNTPLLDSLIGTAIGSVLAGNPLTSYVLGGEMLKQGVSLIAVTAFLVAWVTVGIVQLPAEIKLLGKKFAITRNITAMVIAIMIAILTSLTMVVL